MNDKFFIDSNIFLYAFCDKDPAKQKIASQIVNSSATISVQVINEVSSNMLRKLLFLNSDIKGFIKSCYNRFDVFNLDKNIFINACDIRDKYKISYYDSLIISAALFSKCTILYSEDMQHNQEIEGLKIVNPFV